MCDHVNLFILLHIRLARRQAETNPSFGTATSTSTAVSFNTSVSLPKFNENRFGSLLLF